MLPCSGTKYEAKPAASFNGARICGGNPRSLVNCTIPNSIGRPPGLDEARSRSRSRYLDRCLVERTVTRSSEIRDGPVSGAQAGPPAQRTGKA